MTRPSPTAAELEASLEARLYKRIRLIGGKINKIAPTEIGMPDRLVLLPGGRIFLVELKREHGGRLSPKQILWHQQAAQRGTNVVVLSGLGEIDAWVRQQAQYADPVSGGKGTAQAKRLKAAQQAARAS